MKRILILAVTLMVSACTNQQDNNLPQLVFDEPGNHSFTFTNKISGFFLGNSHAMAGSGHEGWTVNEFKYLRDYQVSSNDSLLARESIRRFTYHPDRFERIYANGIHEQFFMADSINALVWEFADVPNAAKFLFTLFPARDIRDRNLNLSAEQPLLTLSPSDLSGSDAGSKWLVLRLTAPESGLIRITATLAETEQAARTRAESIATNAEQLLADRSRRMTDLLARNRTVVSIPEVNEALAWSQLAVDALVTRQRGPGIWAGLPWFNNYWGRDTFISFAGALLVNGQFEQAREILLSFADFQLTDESDIWYGRIPNRVTNNEIIYNTTDGTWWFVREAYEYLLWSGDSSFARHIFPIIDRAITGALSKRSDRFGFLIHDDADTWMDAKGPNGAWSPRGNRAVEIQALWYTALRIGARLADSNGKPEKAEVWRKASEKLQQNFIDQFWNAYNYKLYDHLNPDGSPDKKVRPNQVFAVTVPDLPGIPPLIPENMQARVASTVVRELTYYYGVASLSQQDDEFHPWHHYEPFYVQDEAYHNGTVWTWLSGPVTSAMLHFHQDNLAFELYQSQARQILFNDAVGNYSELLDALPRPGEQFPRISGTVSQAWNLAEFNRNFYQDFVGYRPDALNDKIRFIPNMPRDVSFLQTRLPFKSGYILFTFQREEDKMTVTLESDEIISETRVSVDFPGYDPVESKLSPQQNLLLFEYKNTSRRMYLGGHDQEWYFAVPALREDLPALKGPGFPLANSKDFFFPPQLKGRTILAGTDLLDDDKGPNGRYIYPENNAFEAGILDLVSFNMDDLGNEWGFAVKMRNLVNPDWHPEYGFQLTYLAIALHYPSDIGYSQPEIGMAANQRLAPDRAFHDIIYVGGGVQVRDVLNNIHIQLTPDNAAMPLGFTGEREIRFRIAKKYLPKLSAQTRVTIFSGAQDDHGGAGLGEFRAVLPAAGEWNGGGADSPRYAPAWFDKLEIN